MVITPRIYNWSKERVHWNWHRNLFLHQIPKCEIISQLYNLNQQVQQIKIISLSWTSGLRTFSIGVMGIAKKTIITEWYLQYRQFNTTSKILCLHPNLINNKWIKMGSGLLQTYWNYHKYKLCSKWKRSRMMTISQILVQTTIIPLRLRARTGVIQVS